MSDAGRQHYHNDIKEIDEGFRNSVRRFSVYVAFPGKSGGHSRLILVPKTESGDETNEGYTVELEIFYRTDGNGDNDSSYEIRPRTKLFSPFRREGGRRIIHIPGIEIVGKLQEIFLLAEDIMEIFESYNKLFK